MHTFFSRRAEYSSGSKAVLASNKDKAQKDGLFGVSPAGGRAGKRRAGAEVTLITDGFVRRAEDEIAPMKRLAQFVAVMVALLVAGQSALAETPCSELMRLGCGHASGCCMAANVSSGSQISTDCHGSLRHEPIIAGCGVSGCRMSTGRVVAAAISEKLKGPVPTSVLAVIEHPVAAAFGPTVEPGGSGPALRPARYLLYQTFRI
jgi:hypothetical protein